MMHLHFTLSDRLKGRSPRYLQHIMARRTRRYKRRLDLAGFRGRAAGERWRTMVDRAVQEGRRNDDLMDALRFRLLAEGLEQRTR